MTKEEQEQLTQIHNKLVQDKYTIESLTAEVTRLREALEKIVDIYSFNASEPGYDWATLDPINDIAKQALTEKTK